MSAWVLRHDCRRYDSAQLYRRWRKALRGRQSGAALNLPLGFWSAAITRTPPSLRGESARHTDAGDCWRDWRSVLCSDLSRPPTRRNRLSGLGQSQTSRPNNQHGRFSFDSGLSRNDSVTAATSHNQRRALRSPCSKAEGRITLGRVRRCPLVRVLLSSIGSF
jgi:hypothetical protein